MSTIIASNISDGTTSVASTYVVNGSAKAWVNFNGTGTVAIRDSLNVSSITDNASGDYTVNFSAAMSDVNYSVGYSSRWNTVGSMTGSYGVFGVEIARTTTSMQTGSLHVWATYPTDQTLYDRNTVCIQIFR